MSGNRRSELLESASTPAGVRRRTRDTVVSVSEHASGAEASADGGEVVLTVIRWLERDGMPSGLPTACAAIRLAPEEAEHLATLLKERAAEARRSGASAVDG